MKKLLKLSMLLFLFVIYSCSESEIDRIEELQIQNNLIESVDDLEMGAAQSTTTCTMYSISYDLGNKTETFGVSSNITNKIYAWSATGSINIIDTNTTNSTVTIQYPNNYTNDGVLIVSVTDSTNSSTHCGVTKHIGTIGNNGNGDCAITANIDEQIPAGYPTPNGKYSLSYVGSSSNVIWSVSNGTIISQNGKFEVIVSANNLSPIILTATVTEGSCVQTFTKKITPINNCAASITASINTDIEVCYPSHHPYGRYSLFYAGASSNVTWSVDYGVILASSGKYEVQVKADSALPFTLTATITEGICVKVVNMVIYPLTPFDCGSPAHGGGGGGGKGF